MKPNLPKPPNIITQIQTKILLIMKKEVNKQVKMHCKYRPSQRSFTNYKQVPWLTISGNWLAQMGFSIGSRVEISAAENRLIITKM
jgi:hypothetical protein